MKSGIQKNPRVATSSTAPALRSRRGHGRATLRDVAEHAGVTAITVSRFLREPALVAAATASRIEASLKATGYMPNKQAGHLASGRSKVVAAIIPSIANSIFAETVQGLSDGLQSAGYELLLASSGYSMEREEDQIRAVLGWFPSALVVTGRHHTPAATRLLEGARTPVIEIWDQERRARTTRFAQVGFDHGAIGRRMAEHLLEQGHRRVVYVDSGVAEDFRAHERGKGFTAAVRSAGARVQVVTAPTGDAFDAGRAALSAAISGPLATLPTALAFANDNLACGALLEASMRGLDVPARLAIMGFGDFPIGRQVDPPLTTIRPPRYEIGSATARLLLAAFDERSAPASLALPCELVVRGSTRS